MISIHEGSLILVNGTYPYVENENNELLKIFDDNISVRLEKRASVFLRRAVDKVGGTGSIIAVSGWRSLREQQEIWDNSMKENGREFTETYVAVPGHSEHQTGLAVDMALKSPKIDFIRPYFPYHGICQSFRENAADFGFIERYSRSKETVTGIGHEPWHFRYVGTPHADIISKNGMALEEYISFVREFTMEKGGFIYEKGGFIFEIYFVLENEAYEKGVIRESDFPYTVSGNNVDGFIVTLWKNR